MDLDNNAHSVFLLHDHLVLGIKYRKQIFDTDISKRAKEIFEYISPNYNITQKTEDIHYRDSFFFSGITFKEQLSKVEPLHKFCGKIRNAVSIIGCLWYT